MKKICDLHTHSCFSDGTATPAELIAAAKAAGLSAVALCDHNTVAGLPDFVSAAYSSNIEAVCGIEFSVDWEGTELHMLGLFIEPESYDKINALLFEVKKRKEKANIELSEALRADGYDIDYFEIKKKSRGFVNRAHFATEMMEKGYAPSVREAFDTYLCVEAGYYREPERIGAMEVIGFIRELGSVPVLAHPFLNLSKDRLLQFIPEAKKAGLVGMETDYSTYSPETAALARSIADSHGLLRSGGSDWHGERKPDISLGIGRGDLFVPYEYFEALKASK